MPVVPIRQQDLGPPPMPPLQQHFLLMAASAMHDDGRLIKPGPQVPMSQLEFNTMSTLAGRGEGEPQGQPDVNTVDEPPQPDQTNDIMRHLHPGLPKGGRDI